MIIRQGFHGGSDGIGDAGYGDRRSEAAASQRAGRPGRRRNAQRQMGRTRRGAGETRTYTRHMSLLVGRKAKAIQT